MSCLDRRTFLKDMSKSTLAAMALYSLPRTVSAAKAGNKPNIILVVADDLGIHEVSCYGSGAVSTPEIDELATQGMKLNNCVAPVSMCVPVRNLLYSGLYPMRNGSIPNHSSTYSDTKTLPNYLNELGYDVYLAGKDHGNTDDFIEYTSLYHRWVPEVEDLLKNNPPEPYCLIIASGHPHRSWTNTGVHDPDTMKIAPYLVDTPELRNVLADYYDECQLFSKDDVGWIMNILNETGKADNTLLMATSDHGPQVPFGKWTCYDAGIHMPFIARWPGHITPGSTSDALFSFCDILPTMIDAAGGTPPDDLDGKSILPVLLGERSEHHSFVYSLYSADGVPNSDHGSCYPIRAVRTKTHKYIRNLWHEQQFTNLFTATETPAKADDKDMADLWLPWIEKANSGDEFAQQRVDIYKNRPYEELYDLVNDPYELNNVIDNQDYADIRTQLSDRVDMWMTQQSDTGTCEPPGRTDPGPGSSDPQGPTGLSVYPGHTKEPARPDMSSSAFIPGNSDVTVLLSSGKVVREKSTSHTLPAHRLLDNLSAGAYTLRIRHKGRTSYMRVAIP